MKKLVLGFVVVTGATFLVYATCRDRVSNVQTPDADNNTACANNASTDAPCWYSMYDPSVPRCTTTTNDTGTVCSSTNNVIYNISWQHGTCDGQGTCHLGVPETDDNHPNSNNNTNANYFGATCGG